MLVIAAIVTRQPLPRGRESTVHVDGLGVLELTWLLGRNMRKDGRQLDTGSGSDAEPVVALQLVDAVPDPTLDNLRSEGKKIEVAFCD